MALKFIDEFEEDFTCYAIQTNGMDETKFVYNLNKITGKKFQRVKDLDVNIKNSEYCFSFYAYHDKIKEIDYFLIKNQSHKVHSTDAQPSLFDHIEESEFVLKKYKEYDYLLKIPFTDEPIFIDNTIWQQNSLVQNLHILNKLTPKERNLLSL